IKNSKEQEKVFILAPYVRDKKGTHKDTLKKLSSEGFLRVYIKGEVRGLDEEIELDQSKRHNIDIVVDRIFVNDDDEVKSRMFSAIETSLQYSNGLIKIVYPDRNNEEKLFSTKYNCATCGINIPNLESNLFSFNKKSGACEACSGLGVSLEADVNLIVPDKRLSINQ